MSPKLFLMLLWLAHFVFLLCREYIFKTSCLVYAAFSLFKFLLEIEAVFSARVYFCAISQPSTPLLHIKME